MLIPVLAHPGQPLAPHDWGGAWNWDPVIILSLAAAGWAYWQPGHRRADRVGRRSVYFALGLGTLTLALVSPLDAMGGVLASAHMVQHLLLMVAAPVLVAASSPVMTILRGLSTSFVRNLNRWRRRNRAVASSLMHPGLVWLVHAGTIWIWHASVLYEAALANNLTHMAEHTSLFLTGLAFWWVVIRSSRLGRKNSGVGILLVFTIGLQGVILSALLTFAGQAWYPTYSDTAPSWGLSALADQQLAGLIMWVPLSLFYVGAILVLVTGWIRAVEPADTDVDWAARV